MQSRSVAKVAESGDEYDVRCSPFERIYPLVRIVVDDLGCGRVVGWLGSDWRGARCVSCIPHWLSTQALSPKQ
jgi:hypothetical protein